MSDWADRIVRTSWASVQTIRRCWRRYRSPHSFALSEFVDRIVIALCVLTVLYGIAEIVARAV